MNFDATQTLVVVVVWLLFMLAAALYLRRKP